MILVDVVFPELGKTIDFQLDENVLAWDVMEEIAGIAAQNSARHYLPKKHRVLLYCMETDRQIDLNHTLRENGVRAGNRLLLI